MVDRINKALRRLSGKERNAVVCVIERIIAGELKQLDVVKLRGRSDVYRVRRGSIRIIFKINKDGSTNLIAILRRSDTTYKDL